MRAFVPALVIWSALAIVAPAAPRPNIIVIMADDMGFSDIGCYGSEIRTPTLDSLAANGVRCTQFYNNARCCPTRASLLTGLYAHQAGIGWMMSDMGLDGYRGELNENCVTIPQVLRTAGYATYMSGKWHVTKTVRAQTDADKRNWPLQRGFDRFFGTIHGAGSFYDPNSLTRDNELIPPGSDDFFYTDAISENAATFITEHDRTQPFFLYVSYTAPHWPMHARPENIAKYKGVYDKGWDAVRAERHQRMIEMGIVDASWPISPRDPRSPAWDDAQQKDWEIRCMEVYAAMIDCMDQGVARIVESLKQTEHFENTLILFLADNGGCAENNGRQAKLAFRDSDPDTLKPMKAGELQFDMIPRRARDGRVVRQGRGVMPGPADTFIAYGLSWANASNSPFREYKHWVHEGGISSPLIAHWPKGIDTQRRGELEPQPGHLIDLMATCVDVSGATYPKQFAGQEITPMQGISLLPVFAGRPLERQQPIFWEHEGNRAVRDGKWKLVAKGAYGKWELYDMERDRTELNNLATRHPARVQEMAAEWDRWAIAAKVVPSPWSQ